jgi:serine/threonine-protein kinase
VADFGIARAIAAAGEEKLTPRGLAIGTPAYMSPEQSSASEELDGRSDIYSLGCVLYEMLAGEPPYTGPSGRAVIAKHVCEPIPRISVVRETVPPAVEQALLKALAKAPEDRFATADQFADALPASGTATIPASAAIVQGRGRLLGAAVALMVVAAVGDVVWRSWQRPEPPVSLDANVIAVLPFRVTARDSAYNYLREGVVDLLSTQLTGDGLPRAVDSRTTLSRWRQAVAARGGELTTSGALELARGLGAGQLLLGELVVTPTRMTVSGRLLRVPGGQITAEYSEAGRAGAMDELAAVDRLLGRLLAMTAGEGRARLPQLSDSTAAVKAYLAGRRAHRRGEHATAARLYQQALEIDSTFALPAYWLTVVSEWTGGGHIVEWGGKAWSLRDRLSARDRAQLAAAWGVGPNYPKPYTMVELIHAAERAAEVSPDRPEALERLGSYLYMQGPAVSLEGWLPRATIALDSAIRLDSGFVGAIWSRLHLALMVGNVDDIRRYGSLYLSRSPTGDQRIIVRWLVARTMGDSAGLAAAGDELPLGAVGELVALSTLAGLPLDELERTATTRFAGTAGGPGAQCDLFASLWHIAVIRGRLSRALALGDSMNMTPGDCGARRVTITLALTEPGYSSTADRYAREAFFSQYADTTAGDRQAVCLVELWRVSRGDTSRTRRQVERIRRMGLTRDPAAPFGSGEVCPSLLEAAIESMRPGSKPSPALDRLDSVMSQGVGLRVAGNVANLLIARRFETQGDPVRALRAIRRRIFNYNYFHTMLLPAYLREEGGLAALTGDTAGAIRAYQHYLRLRDQPDPGPLAEQRQEVKAHLNELVGEKVQR